MVITTCLLAGGCAWPEMPKDDIHASIRKCGLKRQIGVKMLGERQLAIVHLDPNVQPSKFDCFISETGRLGLDLGFLGNEAPPSN